LENVKTKAFDTGRKEGYDEGRYLANEDEEKGRGAALEEGKELGRKEELENKKEAEKQAYKNGWREGHKAGLDEGKEEQEHSQGRCVKPQMWIRVNEEVQMESTTCTTTDSSIQTAPHRYTDGTQRRAAASTE
jgi:hypothetical protein